MTADTNIHKPRQITASYARLSKEDALEGDNARRAIQHYSKWIFKKMPDIESRFPCPAHIPYFRYS